MIIFKTVIYIYIIFSISILVHELFHYVVARAFKFNNIKLHIGDEFFCIKIKKIYFSPLIYKGYVEFDYSILKKIEIIIFFLSGSFGNAVIIILAILLKFDYYQYFVGINFLSIMINLFPLKKTSNDFANMVKYLSLIDE